MSISSLLAGITSEAVGVQRTITCFALAAGLASLAYIALTRPIVRRLELEEHTAHARVSTR
jgi:hypothetical protein